MRIEDFQKKFGIIGVSKEIRELVAVVMQVAKSDISALIYGESGVGKEIIANAVHGYSNRANGPFISVNCGAIPEGILESELFGHKKGSFTGAVDNRKGYFELADGGTLFLDEIGETPLTTQVKLLRVLETQEFMRIGGETTTKVDVRIIAATNKDLQYEVNYKRFREDLYFRLKAIMIYVPPLRKRKEDIEVLTNQFIENFCAGNKIPLKKISKHALNYLMDYDWPGNIRELKNTVETAIALNGSRILEIDDFKKIIINERDEIRNLPVSLNKSPQEVDREMIYRALIEIKKDLMELKSAFYSMDSDSSSSSSKALFDEVIPMEELEKKAIINALKYSKGNRRNASKLLKMSERTLYRKIKDYEIEV